MSNTNLEMGVPRFSPIWMTQPIFSDKANVFQERAHP